MLVGWECLLIGHAFVSISRGLLDIPNCYFAYRLPIHTKLLTNVIDDSNQLGEEWSILNRLQTFKKKSINVMLNLTDAHRPVNFKINARTHARSSNHIFTTLYKS